MSGCDALVRDASAGVAASLRAVDCVSAEATTSAFSRLFGAHGALLPALTVMLTLYVAGFAVLLLTGRARLSLGGLTPRMMTLGLVLTFVTSSVAYQGVVWNLAVGAPDQVAGVLLGAPGSATQMFAERIDILFEAIAETASAAGQGGPPGAAQGAFSPGGLMWLGALLLMLGTVGVLVTARIALAVLLAVGPVFISLALFSGTRGLFVGWLRALALMALTPLFAVLGGALTIELAVPIVAGLRGAEGIDGRAAMALFVVAAVHCALMMLATRVASTLVGGWQVFGLASGGGAAAAEAREIPPPTAAPAPPAAAVPPRLRSLVASLPAAGPTASAALAAGGSDTVRVRNLVTPATSPTLSTRAGDRRRARGIGSRFSRPAPVARKHAP
jgi:type IV secretion system protein VirB6